MAANPRAKEDEALADPDLVDAQDASTPVSMEMAGEGVKRNPS
jgi:hypothetical protein